MLSFSTWSYTYSRKVIKLTNVWWYNHADIPQSAIRTFEFANSLSGVLNSGSEKSLFEILLDSLCKEGHVDIASAYFYRKREVKSNWVPSIRVYNILLNGWFRSGKLKHAEQLWLEMKKDEVTPSMVTYRTLVEGYCCMNCVEKAIELVSELRMQGMEPNAIVYNLIIDALAEAGRLKEALGMMERFLILKSGPTISTYNSLVKGFCIAGNLEGASKILKDMMNRGVVPTTTTYNYFFRYFLKFGKIEEGMNLFGKMIESGYFPDGLTYYLLLKMLCKEKRIELAVQVREEMRIRGIDMNLAMSTMFIHLLCDVHRFEDAFAEFENMIKRGIVPQYLTFQKMNNELKERGMTEMARKLCAMMSSVPHSMKLPDIYNRGASRARRNSIIQKAKGLSDLLKTCKDPRKLIKFRSLSASAVSSATRCIDVKKKKK